MLNSKKARKKIRITLLISVITLLIILTVGVANAGWFTISGKAKINPITNHCTPSETISRADSDGQHCITAGI